MAELAQVGDFCPNRDCTEYGKLQTKEQRNIIKYGFTKSGHQRYLCQVCHESFVETTGTIFYGRRTPDEEILRVLALIAEGSRISSLTRTTGHKEDTILEWLREAGKHTEQIEAVLMSNYQIGRGQIDGLWAFVQNKGEKKAIQKPKRADSSGAQP
jgi:transposase-like protein